MSYSHTPGVGSYFTFRPHELYSNIPADHAYHDGIFGGDLGRIYYTSYDKGHRHSVDIPMHGFGVVASGTSSGHDASTICNQFSATQVEADVKKYATYQECFARESNAVSAADANAACGVGAANAASARATHAIQLALVALGFPVAVDSTWGPETQGAFADWARSVGTNTAINRASLQKMEAELKSRCGGGGPGGFGPLALAVGGAALLGLVVLGKRRKS